MRLGLGRRRFVFLSRSIRSAHKHGLFRPAGGRARHLWMRLGLGRGCFVFLPRNIRCAHKHGLFRPAGGRARHLRLRLRFLVCRCRPLSWRRYLHHHGPGRPLLLRRILCRFVLCGRLFFRWRNRSHHHGALDFRVRLFFSILLWKFIRSVTHGPLLPRSILPCINSIFAPGSHFFMPDMAIVEYLARGLSFACSIDKVVDIPEGLVRH